MSGSKLSSEKVIKLLDYRGEKELARTLRRCWLELDVQDRGSFVNEFVAVVQVHAPLEEYEFLRSLPSSEGKALLAVLKDIYSPEDSTLADFDFVLEIGDRIE